MKTEKPIRFEINLCYGKMNLVEPECNNCSGYERWRDCYKPQLKYKGTQVDKFNARFGKNWEQRNKLRLAERVKKLK